MFETLRLSHLDHSQFLHNKTLDGWKLLADVPVSDEPVLQLSDFLHTREEKIFGVIACARVESRFHVAGQRHAEWLLSLPHLVPNSWRPFILAFPGTIWCMPDEKTWRVPTLAVRQGKPEFDFGWADENWFSGVKMVRLVREKFST